MNTRYGGRKELCFLRCVLRCVQERGTDIMTKKELKKLSREDLLEILIAQSTELESCKERLAEAEEALEMREIAINKAGSIAEASLMLSGIFDSAQIACQQYTDNIRRLSERQEAVCAAMEAQARVKAEEILKEAEKTRKNMIGKTVVDCDVMRKKAKEESERYWADIYSKLRTILDTHTGLREMLTSAKYFD